MTDTSPPLVVDNVTLADEDPFGILNGLLNAYNVSVVGPAKHVPLWLFARDRTGRVQGGVRGQTYWSWGSIDVLAVAEPYRRQGIGSRLLSTAEEIARDRGCLGLRLDTVSFQAPDFYLRNGYTEFGRIDGYPPGHTRLWYMKRFLSPIRVGRFVLYLFQSV